MYPYKREAVEDFTTQRGAGNVKMKEEIGIMWLKPRNTSSWKRKRTDSSLMSLDRVWSY